MADQAAEKILERRRVQNREAQRRFREKKSLQKTVDLLHRGGVLDGLLRSSPPPVDLSLPFPSCPFPETANNTADITISPRPDFLVADDDASLFGYSNTPGDAASRLSQFPTSLCDTTTFSPAAGSSYGIPTPDTSVGTSLDPLSSTVVTRASPQNAGAESSDRAPSNSTSRSSTSATGWLSPLHIAARKGSSRIIRMLLQHNSDCNESDSQGLTPLIHAVMGGHEEATRLLLEHGARIESVAPDGKRPRPSAIHWAVLKRREAVLRVLLDHSLDPGLIESYDDRGRAPLHIAIDLEFDAGVSLLLQFGADPSQKAQQF
ncbi:ankyrin repeat-containing domain protein [Xylaria grammica]|nr:ankyrin repeat-containing domain protein [Xylaria grammica]